MSALLVDFAAELGRRTFQSDIRINSNFRIEDDFGSQPFYSKTRYRQSMRDLLLSHLVNLMCHVHIIEEDLKSNTTDNDKQIVTQDMEEDKGRKTISVQE